MGDTSRMRLLAGLTAGGVAMGIAVALRRHRISSRIHEYTSSVRCGSSSVAPEAYDPDDVVDLPAPVRQYFETVLQSGQPHVEGVRLSQAGEFRLGGADAPWHPFTATQVYSVSPPQYVWDATIELSPLVTARVLDAYLDGEGLLRANLFGAVRVASAGPDPQMNEAELQRYLSETPWFPTALLPAAGVSWKGVDDRSARATINDGGVTATATFHFDEEGYVRQLTADRYRRDEDATAPWVGEYGAYEERGRMSIPTEGEVGWKTVEGEIPYWRGTITGIEYQMG